MVRPHNEDTVFVDGEAGLAVLADGMGGYSAGEVASGIAVNVISSGMLQELNSGRELSKVDVGSGLTHAGLLLQQQIALANKSIYEAAQARPECAGMGTTLVATVFFQNRVSIGHIGDSRCYRLRADRFEQLTHDHSLLQEQIDSGMLTREQAKYSLNKNLVTRALGIEAVVPPDIAEYRVEAEDIYVLCSDGLTDMVEPDVVQRDRHRQAQRSRRGGGRADRCRQPERRTGQRLGRAGPRAARNSCRPAVGCSAGPERKPPESTWHRSCVSHAEISKRPHFPSMVQCVAAHVRATAQIATTGLVLSVYFRMQTFRDIFVPHGKLVLVLADGTTLDVPLRRERIVIGRRADNDVCLPNLAVSGEHAAVVTILTDSFLEDLGSTNGTLVNGKAIAKHFLRDRDEIDVGRHKLVYLVDDERGAAEGRIRAATPRAAVGDLGDKVELAKPIVRERGGDCRPIAGSTAANGRDAHRGRPENCRSRIHCRRHLRGTHCAAEEPSAPIAFRLRILAGPRPARLIPLTNERRRSAARASRSLPSSAPARLPPASSSKAIATAG